MLGPGHASRLKLHVLISKRSVDQGLRDNIIDYLRKPNTQAIMPTRLPRGECEKQVI